jgi:ABC-type tungstate transport system permease subunit
LGSVNVIAAGKW